MPMPDRTANRRQFLRFLAASPLLPNLRRFLQEPALITSPEQALNLMDFEPVAKKAIPPAHWAYLAYDFLDSVSRRIINEVKGISRVVYDISGKPPATIEWE